MDMLLLRTPSKSKGDVALVNFGGSCLLFNLPINSCCLELEGEQPPTAGYKVLQNFYGLSLNLSAVISRCDKMDLFRGFKRISLEVVGMEGDEQVRAEGMSTAGPDVNAKLDSRSIPDTPNPRVGLVDLPNETILHILYFLNDESLFPLAFLSRWLHHLALPLYLSRKGFGQRPDDEWVLFNYNSRDVFKALRVSLFRPSLFRLYYPVDCRKSADDLCKEIGILRDVVRHLSTLQEVVVSFQNTLPVGPGETPELNPIVPLNPDRLVPSNSNFGLTGGFSGPLLISLFDAIISSGCKSFTIRHCGPQNPVLQGVHAIASSNFGGMRSLGRTFARFLKPFTDIFKYSRTSLKNNELTTFHLHSPMAFHSLFCRWTIEMLNSSALVSLSLAQQSCIPEHSWFLILPSIQIPTLTDLSIDFCSIHTSDLVEFLRRQTRLEKLVLGRNFKLQRPPPPFPKHALIRLTHLTAPSDWINYLLASGGSLPSLSSTTILKRVPNRHSFRLPDLNRSLHPSISRLVGMHELHLSLSFGSASSVWMAPITTPSFDPQEPGSEGEDGETDEQNNPRTAHALITHIELSLKVHSIPFALTVRLPKWLAQFPNLRRLDLLTMSGAVEALSGSSYDGETFVDAVLVSCPHLESVEFGRIKNPY